MNYHFIKNIGIIDTQKLRIRTTGGAAAKVREQTTFTMFIFIKNLQIIVQNRGGHSGGSARFLSPSCCQPDRASPVQPDNVQKTTRIPTFFKNENINVKFSKELVSRHKSSSKVINRRTNFELSNVELSQQNLNLSAHSFLYLCGSSSCISSYFLSIRTWKKCFFAHQVCRKICRRRKIAIWADGLFRLAHLVQAIKYCDFLWLKKIIIFSNL